MQPRETPRVEAMLAESHTDENERRLFPIVGALTIPESRYTFWNYINNGLYIMNKSYNTNDGGRRLNDLEADDEEW